MILCLINPNHHHRAPHWLLDESVLRATAVPLMGPKPYLWPAKRGFPQTATPSQPQ